MGRREEGHTCLPSFRPHIRLNRPCPVGMKGRETQSKTSPILFSCICKGKMFYTGHLIVNAILSSALMGGKTSLCLCR